jgi:hypothetical protein
MVHESGSGRLCGRCGSHVGGLSQCPRCRAALPSGTPQHSETPPLTRHPEPPPPTRHPTTSPGGGEPQERSWELPERLERAPGRRRPVVLVGVAAAAALAVTWWLLAARPSAPGEAAGARQEQAAALDHGVPEQEGTGATGEPGNASAEPGDAASPGDSAAEQAGKMNDLLAGSSSARADLSAAIARASRCEKAGLTMIEQVTASRRDQLTAARALGVSALPGGDELKNALVDALDASFDADAAFLSWARRHVAGDCDGPVSEDRDYKRGVDRSQDAQKAKARFAKAWRPIAEAHGLTAWKPGQI